MAGPPPVVEDAFAVKPPTDRELVALLRRGQLRTRLTGCSVGCLTGGLGLFMLALIGFQLDPEVAHMPLAGRVLGVGIAVLFCLVGVGMLGVAVLGRGGGSGKLLRRCQQAPDSIVSARRLVSTANGIRDPGHRQEHGHHMVAVRADDDSEVQVMMSRDDVTRLLVWIQTHVPTATVTGV